jgi:bacillithiol system protein YtxJ
MKLLETLDDLESAIAASAARPVLVLKHSLTCGGSTRALREVETLSSGAPLAVDVVVIHVQAARDVSNAIAERCGVPHESPQVLLLHDGRAVWHASHHRVTADAILEAIERHLPPSPAAAVSAS